MIFSLGGIVLSLLRILKTQDWGTTLYLELCDLCRVLCDFSGEVDERAEQLEKDRKKDNQIVFKVVEPIRKDPNRGMRFVNCSEPINKGRLGHSKAFLYKANKTYKYYD
jgi:hypothetical protein